MSKEEGHELEITELRLGLPGGPSSSRTETKKKRAFFHMGDYAAATATAGGENRVVGWPPVCSYRQRNFSGSGGGGDEKLYVKVSVDGAPFLRKIYLSTPQGYKALVAAFEKLFGLRFGEVLKEGDNSEYVPIYEDKDGDWMLLGDVPWEMFVESCKRLRIMKRSEAMGFGLEPKGYLKGVSEV